jgi:DNA polymerase-3 subunit delta'
VSLPALDDHPHARAVLGGALPPAGRPSHAYLLHGPPGAGMQEAALAFAGALLADGADDPADVVRRVRARVHPDLTWVSPSGASEMLVGDIDESVVMGVTRTPFEARRRVFVLDGAEALNDRAANKLLKTLEEPPDFAHVLLVTDRPGDLLPTIASRCQAVRFEAPTLTALADRLGSHGVAPEQAHACARLGLGDAGRSLRLALGDGPALRHAAEGLGRAIVSGDLRERPWTGVLARAKSLGEAAGVAITERVEADVGLLPRKEQSRARREGETAAKRAARRAQTDALDHGLQLAGLWLRDVACVADGVEDVVHHTDRVAALREDAERVPDARSLRDAVALIDDARAALALNPTEELVVETLASRAARRLSGARVADVPEQR